MPRATSSSVTLPKSSVTPAIVLHGERQIDSPCRRESGRPNLMKAERLNCALKLVKYGVYQCKSIIALISLSKKVLHYLLIITF